MKPKGEHLQSSPTNQKPLLQAWKITKSQADQKFLRLVQTGIEPNLALVPTNQQANKTNQAGLHSGISQRSGCTRVVETDHAYGNKPLGGHHLCPGTLLKDAGVDHCPTKAGQAP